MAKLDEAVASDIFVPLDVRHLDTESMPGWNLRDSTRTGYWPTADNGESCYLACTICGRVWILTEPTDGGRTRGSFDVCQWGRAQSSRIYNQFIRLISERIHDDQHDSSHFLARGFYRFLDRGIEPLEQHYIASLRQALFEYSEAITLGPSWPLPHLRKAVAYLALGDYQNAVSECDETSNLQPDNPRCLEIRHLAILGNLKQELEDAYWQPGPEGRGDPIHVNLERLDASSHMEILYSWEEGTIPPPGYWEYSIRISQGVWNERSTRRWPLGGEGVVTRCPNYSALSPPTWTRSFAVPQAELDKFFNAIRPVGMLVAGKDVEELGPVGDTEESVEVEIDAVQFALRSDVDEYQAHLINAINTIKKVGLSPFQKDIEQPRTLGGSLERLEIELNGIRFRLRTGVHERQERLFSEIRAVLTDLVPPECTDELEALHQEYIAERTHIVGSIIDPGNPDVVKPFVFDWWDHALEMDRYEALASLQTLSEDEVARIAEDLKQAADLPIEIEQIRFGEFWCVDGQHWVEAIEAKWDVDVCLSCSFARGT